MMRVVIDRESNRERSSFLRIVLAQIRNEDIIAHEPRAVSAAQIAPLLCIRRHRNEVREIAATTVVVTLARYIIAAEIHDAVTLHVRLASEEIHAKNGRALRIRVVTRNE